MKKTVVILYPEFSEYEVSVAISILMQGGKPVVVVGESKEPIHGESGLTCLPDMCFEEVDIEDVDSILMTGCMDISGLKNEDKYIDFIKKLSSKVEVIASISSSPYLLAKAGLLVDKKYTIGMTKENREALGFFQEDNYSNELVVQDGNLITARGSGFIKFGVAFGKALGLEFDDRWYKG